MKVQKSEVSPASAGSRSISCHPELDSGSSIQNHWMPGQARHDNLNLTFIRKPGYFIIFIFLLAFNFELLTLNFPKAYADSLSLSISPPLLEVMIRPGKSITQTYNLVNSGEATIIIPRLAAYTINGVEFNGESIKDPWINFLNSDISFDRTFFLEKGQQRRLVLRINPPVGLSEGDYYRTILFSTIEYPNIETSQSSINQSIGSILLVNVTTNGLAAKSGQISKFEIPQVVDSFGPVDGNIEVKNSGDRYFRTIGEITLTGPVGQASFQLLPGIILKEEIKKLQSEMSQSINQFKTFSFKGFFLGRYNLKVEFKLDEGNIIISQTKSFIALPWKLIIVLFLMVVSMIIFRYYLKIKHARKK